MFFHLRDIFMSSVLRCGDFVAIDGRTCVVIGVCQHELVLQFEGTGDFIAFTRDSFENVCTKGCLKQIYVSSPYSMDNFIVSGDDSSVISSEDEFASHMRNRCIYWCHSHDAMLIQVGLYSCSRVMF